MIDVSFLYSDEHVTLYVAYLGTSACHHRRHLHYHRSDTNRLSVNLFHFWHVFHTDFRSLSSLAGMLPAQICHVWTVSQLYLRGHVEGLQVNVMRWSSTASSQNCAGGSTRVRTAPSNSHWLTLHRLSIVSLRKCRPSVNNKKLKTVSINQWFIFYFTKYVLS